MREQENIGAVVIVVHEDGDKILMGERKNSYKAGWYGMPGGKIEFEEPLPRGAARELTEETTLVPNSLVYLGVVREKQEDYTFIHFGFVTRDYSGQPKNVEPEKCVGWEWHPLDNLPTKILPGHQALIDILLNPESDNYRDILTDNNS